LLEYQEILALKNGAVVAENVINLTAIHPLTHSKLGFKS